MNSLTHITLRVLDGPDKGLTFNNVELPASVGREPGNKIALNDERVSRYHCKIQEDHNEIILIDAESTNGTKLNGQPIWLGTLHAGDIITIGQTMLVVGSREEILQRLATLNKVNMREAGLRFIVGDNTTTEAEIPAALIREFSTYSPNVADAIARLHSLFPPELPRNLQPEQAAKLADLLLYIQLRLRFMIDSVEPHMNGKIVWNPSNWQCLIDLIARITDYHCQLSGKQGDS